MSHLFQMKFTDGYFFKILTELMKNNVSTACFNIDMSGMSLNITDTNKTILLEIKLRAEDCELFMVKHETQLSLDTKNLYNIIRTIKKKDTLLLSISEKTPTSIDICIEPRNSEQMSMTSTINITMIQNLEIVPVPDFGAPVTVNSASFHKMIKSMATLSPLLTISTKQGYISFTSENNGVLKKVAEFGTKSSGPSMYSDEFNVTQFSKTVKIAGLGNSIDFYTEVDSPFVMMKSDIGSVGEIRLFIKSKRQIESEL